MGEEPKMIGKEPKEESLREILARIAAALEALVKLRDQEVNPNKYRW